MSEHQAVVLIVAVDVLVEGEVATTCLPQVLAEVLAVLDSGHVGLVTYQGLLAFSWPEAAGTVSKCK